MLAARKIFFGAGELPTGHDAARNAILITHVRGNGKCRPNARRDDADDAFIFVDWPKWWWRSNCRRLS